MEKQTKSAPKNAHDDDGYTLMELLVVMAILAVLALVVTPQVMGRFSTAKTKAAALQIESLAATVDMFYLDLNRYPTVDEGIGVLWKKPTDDSGRWTGPYVRKPQNLIDPWGNEYHYRLPGTGQMAFDIYSLGSDGQDGGEGEAQDIGSWPEEGSDIANED